MAISWTDAYLAVLSMLMLSADAEEKDVSLSSLEISTAGLFADANSMSSCITHTVLFCRRHPKSVLVVSRHVVLHVCSVCGLFLMQILRVNTWSSGDDARILKTCRTRSRVRVRESAERFSSSHLGWDTRSIAGENILVSPC